MGSGFQIVFLGTGGGRFVTITQKRRTAGIRILGDSLNLHLDPGPGAMVHSIDDGYDPQRVNAVFVSHCHPDHYTDAEVLVEAMTHGMTRKRGMLVAPVSVLAGSAGCEQSISKYHQGMVEETVTVTADSKFKIGDVEVCVTEARHTDPDAVGFRFHTDHGDFAYTSDTEYFDGISEHYQKVRVLALCVMRPSGKPWKGHMSTDDAVRIVNETHPEHAIMTHLGMSMLNQGPGSEAKLIEKRTGVPTVAAVDGMIVNLGETVTMKGKDARTQRNITGFL